MMWPLVLVCWLLCPGTGEEWPFPQGSVYRLPWLREEVRREFTHAYDSYMRAGFPHDELRPLSCAGVNTGMGPSPVTLIDSLDTLAVMGNLTEFKKRVEWVSDNVKPSRNSSRSTFESTIRALGGLLSSHELALRLIPSSYDGRLLDRARELGEGLLPAFETASGLPLRAFKVDSKGRSIPVAAAAGPGEHTTAAEAGTLVLEFGVLSYYTGDCRFVRAAANALAELWERRSHLDLVGSTLDVRSGTWQGGQSHLGGGGDSFYEYLFKGYLLTGDPCYLRRWEMAYAAIQKYMLHPPGVHVKTHFRTGQPKAWVVNGLQAFFPGLQVLAGDVEGAVRSYVPFLCLVRRLGVLPEEINVREGLVTVPKYLLRPEFLEATWWLYRATHSPLLLEVAEGVLRSLQKRSRVPCGYAALKHVGTNERLDSMDSFFLAETLKYLWLIFEDASSRTVDLERGWVLNTEAHPLPLGAKMASFCQECMEGHWKGEEAECRDNLRDGAQCGWRDEAVCTPANDSFVRAHLLEAPCFEINPFLRESAWLSIPNHDPAVVRTSSLPAFRPKLRDASVRPVSYYSNDGVQAGSLIIAHPGSPHDGFFHRTVVLLYRHDETGTLGVVLNKKGETHLGDNVFVGGPVPHPPVVVHACHGASGLKLSMSFDLQHNASLAGGMEKFYVTEPLDGNGLAEVQSVFSRRNCPWRPYYYISSWFHGQLWMELARRSWLTAEVNAFVEYLLYRNVADITETLWGETLHHMGGVYTKLAGLHHDPEYNGPRVAPPGGGSKKKKK